MLKLRDYQEVLVEDIRQAYRNGDKAVLAVLPTGGGKTAIFSFIATSMAAKDFRSISLVHRVELLRQTYRAMKKLGVDPGLVSPHYTPNPRALVQVASVQTMANRVGKYEEPRLIIIDEAHHATAGTWRKIIKAYPNAKILGVTATPVRGDGKGLGKKSGGVFDVMVEGPQIYELIDQGYLCPATTYRPKTVLNLKGIKTLGSGDYNLIQLAEAMDKPSITGDAVHYYAKHAHCQPAVAFCVNVAHAQHVAEQFRAAGYRAQSVDGSMSDDERGRILGGLGDGSIHVVTSCDIISEGTDIPAIACAILLRPTKSEGLYLQQVGRALRPIYAPGFDLETREGRLAAIAAGPKPNGAIILDHVANTSPTMHGLPHWHRDWSLDGEINGRVRKAMKLQPIKQCSKCYAMYEPPATSCPQCGFTPPVKERGGPRQVDGELVKVEDDVHTEQMRRIKADSQLWLKLKAIGKKKGWSDAFVRQLFAEQRQKTADDRASLHPFELPFDQPVTPNYLLDEL